jgi:mannose-6-phosphate isomerase-like protein (cupin superfamily)
VKRRRSLIAGFLILSLLAGAIVHAESEAAALAGIVGDTKLEGSIESWIAKLELDDDEPLRVIELGRDQHTSHHLVAIRGGERLHRHDRSDQTVFMLRGHGIFRFASEEKPVGEGSVLHVPRKTAHAFQNRSDEPAVAYVIYTPPIDAEDRIIVAESFELDFLQRSRGLHLELHQPPPYFPRTSLNNE